MTQFGVGDRRIWARDYEEKVYGCGFNLGIGEKIEVLRGNFFQLLENFRDAGALKLQRMGGEDDHVQHFLGLGNSCELEEDGKRNSICKAVRPPLDK